MIILVQNWLSLTPSRLSAMSFRMVPADGFAQSYTVRGFFVLGKGPRQYRELRLHRLGFAPKNLD